MRTPFLVLTALAFSGCASPAAMLDAMASSEIAAPPAAFVLACPGGSPFSPACVGVLSDPLVQLSEPSLAVRPGDPDVMAVGVHAIGPTALVPAAQLVQGRVYVTEDAGGTWRSTTLPLPEDAPPGSSYSDPAVVFDAEGRLHASGMVIGPRGDRDIFATVSDDLGRSWSPGQRLATDVPLADRNWNAVLEDGTVVVTWQSARDSSWAAWSRDGGRTWARLDEGVPDCYTASPAAQVGDQVWLGCYVKDEVVHLHSLDLDARTTRPLGPIPGATCIAPRILPAPDGSIVVTCYGGYAARSTDGGASWGPAIALSDLTSVEDEWPAVQVYWSVLDASGALHVLLAPLHRPPLADHVGGQEMRAAHAAIDPGAWSLLSETRLTPDGPEVASRPPASVPPSLGDDWWGIDLAGGEGRLVWMRGGAIEWATLRAPS